MVLNLFVRLLLISHPVIESSIGCVPVFQLGYIAHFSTGHLHCWEENCIVIYCPVEFSVFVLEGGHVC